MDHLTDKSVVVLDNARAHYQEEALDLIEEKGASVLFLPPYSPDLNPIEMFWAKFTTYLKKKKAKTIETLYEVIADFFETENNEKLTKYILHCGAYRVLD